MRRINSGIQIVLLTISAFMYSCNPENGKEELPEDRIKYRQYLVEGKRLYTEHCSNCHLENGTGLRRLYPPLKDSDWYKKEPENIACIIKNGQTGEVIVNGVVFNQPMPENPRLTNLEIAEIMTYVYREWGKKKYLFSHVEIDEFLENCQ